MVNIVEIVDKLPIGTKLYSTICGECTIKKIYKGLGFDVISKDGTTYNFSYDGRFDLNGECLLFPSKDNRDWNNFRPFKDGDIISNGEHIAIFHKFGKPEFCTYDKVIYYHCWYNKKYKKSKFENGFGIGRDTEYNFATDEEKQKLFDVIRENGYKWNAETKTLEKMIVTEFKDGDILTYTGKYTTTFIYKDDEPYLATSFYVGCNDAPSHNFFIYNKYTLIALNENCDVRLATEDEKIKLFDAIKANGYKWNTETKTLEKLIVPKFKAGDKIKEKNESFPSTRTIGSYVEGIGYYTTIHDWVRIEDQDNWELVPTPKFKVGDRIIRCNTLYPILTIIFVNNMVYTVKSNISDEEHDIGVKIVENCYKIATFSPSDLKPFDRLLVKRHNTWQIAHFGYFKNGVIFTEMGQPCNIDVVPYNDETKPLLGTCDEYDGFYKWWN